MGQLGLVGMDDLFPSSGFGLRGAKMIHVMSCSECTLAFYIQTWKQDVGSCMVTFTCFVADPNCFC